MARKLKGKATTELKGEGKRRREREYEKAREFLMKILPIIFLAVVLFLVYFSYRIMK